MYTCYNAENPAAFWVPLALQIFFGGILGAGLACWVWQKCRQEPRGFDVTPLGDPHATESDTTSQADAEAGRKAVDAERRELRGDPPAA